MFPLNAFPMFFVAESRESVFKKTTVFRAFHQSPGKTATMIRLITRFPAIEVTASIRLSTV